MRDGQIYSEIFLDYDKRQVYDLTTGKSESISQYAADQKNSTIYNYMRANFAIVRKRRVPRINVMYLSEGKIIENYYRVKQNRLIKTKLVGQIF
jgi:hypothetical protein